MSPGEAQINYILTVQRLHGYGVEYYKAHDTDGKEVFLGTSFVGMLVKPSNSEERTIYFEWDKICKFVRNKKSLGIVSGQQTLYYHLQDNDQCKYIWRIVSKFHWFYKSKPFSIVTDHDITKPIDLSEVPKFTQMPDIQLSSIADHIDDPANTRAYINMVASETPHMADMYMNLKRNESNYDTASPEPVYSNGLPAYRPAPSYDEAVNRRNQLNKMHSSSPDLASLPLYQNTSAFSTPDLYKPPPDVIRALDKSMENIAEACEETAAFKLPAPFHCQQSSNVSESSQKSIFYEIASPVLINADRQPIDERRRQLETRLAQAETEFESIAPLKANADFFIGKQSITEYRNRDTGILPYDHNRIKLSSTSSNASGYINASSIKLRLPGSSRRHPPTMEWRFIVGQLPSNKETEWDLWQMIWEKKVSTIVLLDNETMYWNREINHSKIFGDMEVYTKCVDRSSPGYATWRLRVMNKNTAVERDIWQLELTSWPDSNAFMSLIQECRTLQASNHESSLLVLCENGAGKSGSYVLADVMTACLQSNADVDLPKVLRLIREQRMHAVQTAEQYIFVYRTLLRFLDASRLI
ncbi:DgyrCDS8476 [Dimorphilus gyrociliatus]|uniref:protein-tyrosine-phosphatase n=1 Tax=Dimorphilus gyrociliatus TaxID=2664684 RepID=A0A7I8VWH3_9ANNE|nr:DgyrCDS8476 [Dimorphilus gyrociliatus]